MSASEDPIDDVSHRDIFGDSESESEDEFEGFDQPAQENEAKKHLKDNDDNKDDDKDGDANDDANDDNEDNEKNEKSLDEDENEDKEKKDDEQKNERDVDSDDDDEDIFRHKKKTQLDASSDSEAELDEMQNILNAEDDDEDENDSSAPGPSKPKEKAESEIESEDEDRRDNSGMVYDFDIMLQKKKSQNRRKRKKNVDIINDNDDLIAELLADMRKAAEDDFIANEKKIPSLNKLKMLDVVAANLMKIDYREALLDSGVLRVIAAWLSRLPDGSLPCLKIRTTMLNILTYLNTDDIDMIKASGLGKVVMYVFKNPKETKENKIMAGKLITQWSKNIFNIETEGGANLRDERERRDHEMYQMKRRASAVNESIQDPKRLKEEAQAHLRPGEKGWIPRARVPAPSMKDYVIRPKSKIDIDLTKTGSKKEVSRLEKHLRAFKEKKKVSKTGRMFTVSIEGRKM